MVTRDGGGLSSGQGARIGKGEPFVFGTGAALLVIIGLVLGVLLLLACNGLSFFWPKELVRIETRDGTTWIGQEWRREPIPLAEGSTEQRTRTQYRVGNDDVFKADFVWVDDDTVTAQSQPHDLVVFERLAHGIAIGALDLARGVKRRGTPVDLVAGDPGGAFDRLLDLVDEAEGEREGNLAPTPEQAELVAEIVLSDGRVHPIVLAEVVRAYRPNDLSVLGKLGIYFSRISEFVSAPPRESNTAGGVFPAILGTLLLVLMMTLAAVPLGVVAALYLNEYAKPGALVRLVRLAVSNLAGVPSIVFGMFGLAFFVYTIGDAIDAAFYPGRAEPVFGTTGLLWAALTLALLTVPVVIVSTEEALRATPRAQREGALALGATKWQAIRTVILPASLPGILTGAILAIARGAGEVAPLMLTGAMKLAPAPLIDGEAPFFHPSRKFMHLGFHIYDVGFQSPNVEATKPIVYSTALLLLVLIIVLNLTAILFRNHVRRRLAGGVF